MNKIMKIICSIVLSLVVLAFIFLVDQGIVGDDYMKYVLNLAAIYALVSVSMNLVNGFTGLFSLGQAGFMAIGAFTVAITTVPLADRPMIYYVEPQAPWLAGIQLHFFVALILGGIFAAIVGLLIGWPVLRLKSDYLAIATLGFSEIIRIVFNNLQTVTNGALGIKSIPGFKSMFVPFGVAAICILIIVLLIHSTYGRAFKAIREDDIAAEAMGINLAWHKSLSFAVSAFFTGIAGGLYAGLLKTVDPKTFSFTLTYTFLLIIVLGGLGSVTGTILATFLVIIGLEWLRFFDEPLTLFGVNIPLFRSGFRMVVFSILLMVVVLFFRKGIMGQKEFSWDAIIKFPSTLRKCFVRKARKGGKDNE